MYNRYLSVPIVIFLKLFDFFSSPQLVSFLPDDNKYYHVFSDGLT